MDVKIKTGAALLTACICNVAFAQQCVHIHTPHPIPIIPQAHVQLPQAQAPTPTNFQWEREKLRLQHEYRMRELSGGRLPEDDIEMFKGEPMRRWSDSKGRSIVAQLVSFNRKTKFVKLRKNGFIQDAPKYKDVLLDSLSKDDQLYILKAAAR